MQTSDERPTWALSAFVGMTTEWVRLDPVGALAWEA